ncbi:MAG: hypothetical protein GXO19_05030 [Epsilonproteobacteria bacterium]|nr:hypothetical protein [Campylobacterota bacterium]NPA57081.1 hypothetical protein [Campylobacterota bacterium]
MFKELLASVALLFSSLADHPQIDHKTSVEPQQVERSRSVFHYTSPTEVVGKVYVGNYESITTDTVRREYLVKGVTFDAGRCIIAEQVPSESGKLDSNGYFNFKLTFASPCPTDFIYVSGDLVMENSVKTGEETFTSQSLSRFGPIKVVNMEPIRFGNVDFIVEAPHILYTNTQGEVRFLLMDRDTRVQVKGEDVQELTIRSSNSSLLRIVTDDGKSVGEVTLSHISEGSVRVESFGEDGEASLIMTAKIANEEGFIQKVNKVVPFKILYKPQSYMVEVENEDQAIIVGQINHLTIKVIGSEDLRPLPAQKIEQVVVKSLNENAQLIDIYGNLHRQIVQREISSGSIDVLVKGEKVGQAEFEVTVFLKGIPNLTKVVKKVSYPVTQRLNNTLTLEYVGSEYNSSTGFFIDTYTLKLRSSRYNGNRVHITLLNPKIDTDWYYQQGHFFTFDPLAENSHVYFDGFRDGLFTGTLERVGEDSLKFSSSLFDLTKVETYRDKLIVIPNGSRQDPNYLGGWTITSIIDRDEILLQGSMERKRVDRLTFVIGNESRWDPKRETISSIMLDHADGVYTIKDRQVRFQIIYPKFFGGKDIFINASIGDGRVRLGNSFKRTLTGTELTMPETMSCKDASLCSYHLQIVYTDASYGLSYSNFGAECLGEKVSYFYFTPTRNRCLSRSQLGSVTGRLNLQKTDGWGFVKLCIYPAPKYEETKDEKTGEVQVVFKGYEDGTVRCTNPEVATEFPY